MSNIPKIQSDLILEFFFSSGKSVKDVTLGYQQNIFCFGNMIAIELCSYLMNYLKFIHSEGHKNFWKAVEWTGIEEHRRIHVVFCIQGKDILLYSR